MMPDSNATGPQRLRAIRSAAHSVSLSPPSTNRNRVRARARAADTAQALQSGGAGAPVSARAWRRSVSRTGSACAAGARSASESARDWSGFLPDRSAASGWEIASPFIPPPGGRRFLRRLPLADGGSPSPSPTLRQGGVGSVMGLFRRLCLSRRSVRQVFTRGASTSVVARRTTTSRARTRSNMSPRSLRVPTGDGTSHLGHAGRPAVGAPVGRPRRLPPDRPGRRMMPASSSKRGPRLAPGICPRA